MRKFIFVIFAILLSFSSAQALELVRQRNQSTAIMFPLTNTTGSFIPGAGGLDSELSIRNISGTPGGFADAASEAVEQGSTGIYHLNLSAAEMNNDFIMVQIKFTNTSAVTQFIPIRTITGDPRAVATTPDIDFINGTTKSLNTTLLAANANISAINSTTMAINNTVIAINNTVIAINGSADFINGTTKSLNTTLLAVNGNVSAVNNTVNTINTNTAATNTTVTSINNTAVAMNTTAAAIKAVTDKINFTGSNVNSTVLTNNDKTGYTVSTVSDKSGYSLVSSDYSNITNTTWGNTTRSITDKTGFSLVSGDYQNITNTTWGNTTRTLSAGTNIVLAKGTGITGFNDILAADIWSVATRQLTAAQTFNITGNLSGSVGSVINDVNMTQAAADKVWLSATRSLTDKINFALTSNEHILISNQTWDTSRTGHTGAGTFGFYLDAQVSTVGGGSLTAADIRAEMDANSTKLSGITNATDGDKENGNYTGIEKMIREQR